MEPLPDHDPARIDATPGDSDRPETTRVDDLAARIAARIAAHIAARSAAGSAAFADAAREFEDEYRRLLAAIASLHPRFAFDRDGRPGAIAAVRNALPAVECDLLDAIVDDHACEVAAIEEALWRVARAAARGADRSAAPGS